MRSVKFIIFLNTFWGITQYCSPQEILDGPILSGCSWHTREKGWQEAMNDCKKLGKMLLCYKSREDINEIVNFFPITAKQQLWISARSCKADKVIKECLFITLHKSGMKIGHHFGSNCKNKLPFICCPGDSSDWSTTPVTKTSASPGTKKDREPSTAISFTTPKITTLSTRSTSITQSTASSSARTMVSLITKSDNDSTTSAYSTTAVYSTSPMIITSSTAVTSSPSIMYCKTTKRRGVLWPETTFGLAAEEPCPGKSRGIAKWYCLEASKNWSPSGPDMSQCHSTELENLKEKFNNMTAKECVDGLTTLYKDDKTLQGNDMLDSVNLISKLPDKLFHEVSALPERDRYELAEDAVAKTTAIFDKMIRSDVWSDVPGEKMSSAGSQLLSSVDNFGLLLARTMTDDRTEYSIIKKSIMLEIVNEKHDSTLNFPRNEVSEVREFNKNGRITLFEGYANHFDHRKGPISIVYTFYSDMNNILISSSGTGIINSPVVSISVGQDSLQPTSIPAKVHILVEHIDSKPNDSACVFWNLKANMWDNAGCDMLDFNYTHSLCACDHLTNFAVLMDFRGAISKNDHKSLFFITVIGCSLSIVSLAICITVFTCYRYHQRNAYNVRYSIHRNLCMTLFLANVLLLSGLDRTENQLICGIIAGFLHYLFLSAFSWMFLEGVHIYLLLVIVFASKRTHSEKYYLFGYGFPLLIVGITAIWKPKSYGTPERCWLSTEDESMWSFTGPVAFILLGRIPRIWASCEISYILIPSISLLLGQTNSSYRINIMMNIAALVLAQWKAAKISVKNDKLALVKRWLRVTVILFPILGLTWALGFLCVGEYATVMAYIFAFFNSLQGFCIFVFHCVMDKKVRAMVTASIKRKRATVTTGSADSKRTAKRGSGNSNTRTESVNSNDQEMSFRKMCQNQWNQLKKPWTFYFTLNIAKQTSSSMSEEQEKLPTTVMTQRNSFQTVKAQ